MSNIGEAQITRLTRERLAAIKKFLPVRDSFRDNLQARQQAKMTFTTDTKQLFEPITTDTKEVVTAIKESQPVVEVKPVKTTDNKVQELRNKFTEEFLADVDIKKLDDLTGFAAIGYYTKEKYLKPEHRNYIKNRLDFTKAVYKIKNEISQIKNDDPMYQKILTNTERISLEYQEQMYKEISEQKQRKEEQKQRKEEQKTN